MPKRAVIVVWLSLLAVAGGLLPASDARAEATGKVYWTEDGEILRADLDGSDMEVLVSGLGIVLDLELDRNGGKMYWADFTNYKIQRANLDGSDTEDLVTDANATAGIALDVAANRMYWTNHQAAKIRRANLDGTNVEDLIALEDCLIPTGCPGAIAVDPSGGKLYWTRVSQAIQRANLDGSDVEDLVGVTVFSTGLAVDSAGNKLYWTVSIPPVRVRGRRVVGSDEARSTARAPRRSYMRTAATRGTSRWTSPAGRCTGRTPASTGSGGRTSTAAA